MTLTELIALVRDVLREPSTGNDVLTDAGITAALNRQYQLVVGAKRCLKRTGTLACVSGQAVYALPEDFTEAGDLLSVRWGTALLAPIAREDLDGIEPGWRDAAAGTPTHWYREDGRSFGVYPPPGSGTLYAAGPIVPVSAPDGTQGSSTSNNSPAQTFGSLRAGFSQSQAYGVDGIDMSVTPANNKFKIQADAMGAPVEITFDWTGCTNGTLVAAQVQAAIRAYGVSNDINALRVITATFVNLGGLYRFVVTSGTLAEGAASRVVITPSIANDASSDLSLGVPNGGAEYQGVMQWSTNNAMRVKCDVSAWSDVTFDWTGCDTAVEIAAQVQLAIRALGGYFASMTAAWDAVRGKYVLTSPTVGRTSLFQVQSALANDAADPLNLGTAQGGAEVPGTGGCALLASGNDVPQFPAARHAILAYGAAKEIGAGLLADGEANAARVAFAAAEYDRMMGEWAA